jgi:hypothetical protein
MNGMEFTATLVNYLAWPAVILFVLIAYRRWLTSSLSPLIGGVRSLRVKAAGVELESTFDVTGRDVAAALTKMPVPASGPVPTSLVDLIDVVNKNPREGIQAAFGLVRQALGLSYPQLDSVAPGQLVRAMQHLVRRGALDAEVESAVSQVYQLFEATTSGTDPADPAQGLQFLILAEGAIHAILRSAVPQPGNAGDDSLADAEAVAPIKLSWRGQYNDSYPIELRITSWGPDEFYGTMSYPGSGTVTDVVGQADGGGKSDGDFPIEWEETGYSTRGDRAIEFTGLYRATVTGNEMTGAWYYHDSDRTVARFEMKAIEARAMV